MNKERWLRIGQYLAMILTTGWAYFNCLYSRFDYDDIPLIVENADLRRAGGLFNLLKVGRPLRAITFWLDYRLWGMDATGYHLTNLILHCLCVLAAFLLLKRLFNDRGLAFLAALLFALHPANTEAVIGIAHRKEMLCFLFMTLCMLAFFTPGKRKFWLGLSLGFYLLALLSKQVGLTVPFLILLATTALKTPAALSRRRLLLELAPFLLIPVLAFLFALSDFKLFASFAPADFGSHRYLQILATQLSFFPVYLKQAFFPSHLRLDYYVVYAQSFFEPGPALGTMAFLASLAALFALLKRKSEFAFGWGWFMICLLPVMNWVPANAIIAERYLYIPDLGVALVVALAFKRAGLEIKDRLRSKSFSAALTGLAVFLVLFLELSGFGYCYQRLLWLRLPEIGPQNWVFAVSGLAAGLILTGAARFWNRRQGEEKKSFLPESLFFLALAMIGAVLTFLFATWLAYHRLVAPIPGTSTHFPDWVGVVSYAENRPVNQIVSEAPLPARKQLLMLIARYIYFVASQGGPFLSYSVGSFPLLNFVLFTLLGVALWLAGIARYGRSLPGRKPAWSLAILFAPILLAVMFSQVKDRTGKWGWELALWRSTIRENSNSFTGWNNLGRAYVTRNRLPEAVSCFIQAHSLEPYRLDPILNLGNTMVKLKNLDAAEHYYRWALKLNPFSFVAQINLGNCLAAKKDYQAAVSIYMEALQVQPDSFEATYNLAWCFYQLGDRGRAWIYLQKTLQLAPNHRPSLILLEQLKQSP